MYRQGLSTGRVFDGAGERGDSVGRWRCFAHRAAASSVEPPLQRRGSQRRRDVVEDEVAVGLFCDAGEAADVQDRRGAREARVGGLARPSEGGAITRR
jgi:hypothetical protein